MVAPGMFVGRIPEIRGIENHLFQTRNGNPQHFLLQGERGIGKSSLFLYLDYLATGQIKTSSEGQFKFVTANVDLTGCTELLNIVQVVARGFKAALSRNPTARERGASVWKWLTAWEVLGVRFHKENPDADALGILDELVENIATFCSDTSSYSDGILFLLDETDAPDSDAGLGQFVKTFTERLTRRGCSRVSVGMAGLPVVLDKLRQSHESSPRIFHTLLLEPLEDEERRRVIRTGLSQANDVNGYPITISDDALEYLIDLSEGYPHFIQQFSYCAFDKDYDDVITVGYVFRDCGLAAGFLPLGNVGSVLAPPIGGSNRVIIWTRKYRAIRSIVSTDAATLLRSISLT